MRRGVALRTEGVIVGRACQTMSLYSSRRERGVQTMSEAEAARDLQAVIDGTKTKPTTPTGGAKGKARRDRGKKGKDGGKKDGKGKGDGAEGAEGADGADGADGAGGDTGKAEGDGAANGDGEDGAGAIVMATTGTGGHPEDDEEDDDAVLDRVMIYSPLARFKHIGKAGAATLLRPLSASIAKLYADKAAADRDADRAREPRETLAAFTVRHAYARLGTRSAVEASLSKFVKGVIKFGGQSGAVGLYARFCGLAEPVLGRAELDAFLHILERLHDTPEQPGAAVVVDAGETDAAQWLSHPRARIALLSSRFPVLLGRERFASLMSAVERVCVAVGKGGREVGWTGGCVCFFFFFWGFS
jgi:hypothetical protein